MRITPQMNILLYRLNKAAHIKAMFCIQTCNDCSATSINSIVCKLATRGGITPAETTLGVLFGKASNK